MRGRVLCVMRGLQAKARHAESWSLSGSSRLIVEHAKTAPIPMSVLQSTACCWTVCAAGPRAPTAWRSCRRRHCSEWPWGLDHSQAVQLLGC